MTPPLRIGAPTSPHETERAGAKGLEPHPTEPYSIYMTMTHRSTVEACIRPTLIADAKEAGRKIRNAVRRGDTTAEIAFHHSGVGGAYMTQAEYTAAKAAFCKAAR